MSDVHDATERLLRRYRSPSDAAGKALENAFDLAPGSRGRIFWTEVLEALASRGVVAITLPPQRARLDVLPLAVDTQAQP